MRSFLMILASLLLFGCKENTFEKDWTTEQSPNRFTARFETTKGDFEIEVTRNLSPKAADRLYQLIRHGYYDNAFFYRVVPGFVAQFGTTDTLKANAWKKSILPDEPVKLGNKRGMVSFARLGENSRNTELFINLADNPVLDTLAFEGVKGFPAFGRVTKGMETVDQLYSGYGEETMSDPNLYGNPSAFYKAYPKLDRIRKAYLTE